MGCIGQGKTIDFYSEFCGKPLKGIRQRNDENFCWAANCGKNAFFCACVWGCSPLGPFAVVYMEYSHWNGQRKVWKLIWVVEQADYDGGIVFPAGVYVELLRALFLRADKSRVHSCRSAVRCAVPSPSPCSPPLSPHRAWEDTLQQEVVLTMAAAWFTFWLTSDSNTRLLSFIPSSYFQLIHSFRLGVKSKEAFRSSEYFCVSLKCCHLCYVLHSAYTMS